MVRPQLNRVERGSQIVHLEPRSMQVLVCLAEHAPEVMSKDRLIQAVWGDVFVGDEVVSHAVWELRKAFADDARQPLYIRTVPKVGYGLVARVSFEIVQTPYEEGRTLGRYQLLGELGGGAMGVVYRARDTLLEREVALKLLPPELTRDPEFRRRFLREARAAARLDHVHLGTVHEIGETDDGQLFIVMTCYSGETLRSRIERGRLSVDEAVELARQIAAGLAEAHRHGIVHRDVKPANVIVTEEGVAKLVDFGLAKLLGATSLTRTGTSFGTPTYKSPEQTLGEDVDQRTDVWSLGAVLYEAVAGRPPFGGEYEQALARAILEDEPLPLSEAVPGVPAELEQIVFRALEKDRDRRYTDAGELQAELERFQACLPLPPAPPAPDRPRRWPWILAAAVLALVLGFGAWYFTRPPTVPAKAREVGRFLAQGRAYSERGDTRENLQRAEESFRRALELAPDEARVQGELAAHLARIQRHAPTAERAAEVDRLISRALATDADTAIAWTARARMLLLAADPGAVDAARHAIEADPEDYRGYTLLGEALIDQGKVEEGLAALRGGIERGEGYVWARLTLARCLADLGRKDEAVVEYRKVLDYRSDLVNALNNLALLLVEMGRDSDALPLLHRALESQPDDRVATNLGLVYYRLGRSDEALEAFRQAHELAPGEPNHLRNLGDMYEELGDAEAARSWYEQALMAYDQVLAAGAESRTRALRAVCAAKLGRFDEARADADEAVRREPSNADVLLFAAQVYALAADRDTTLELTRRCLAAGVSREQFRGPPFQTLQEDARFRSLIEGSSGDL